jgi:DNA-binding SARP family transcriptional activator
MLRLTTFGGLAIRLESAEVTAPTEEPTVSRRGLALLALLAAGPEAGVSRDTLAAYLWPESDDEHARNALRQTIHTLRRELGQPDFLLGGVALRLDPSIISSDVSEFNEARAAGHFERAAACYRGPFLDGFHVGGVPEFERWVDRQRADYAGRATAAMETLAREATLRQDGEAAVEWWRRLADMDPLNSRVARELVTALAAAGNTAGALRHAREHDALVREELGVGPDAAFASAVTRIRSGSADSARVGLPPPPSGAPAVPTPSPSGGPPRDRQASHARGFREGLERELAGRYALEGEAEVSRDGSVRLIRARDLRHDRPVTLKVVHPSLASVLDVERFLREIKLTARLQHPHILPLLDSGEVGGRPWYAVPRPDGETLRSRLSREPRVPLEDAIRFTRELADGLEHAHAQGVIHRDVSPENVLLTGGHALLINLGIARALDAAAGTELTDTGILVGTPAYMSPEQAAGERQLGRRSDIYSLALVLYEMIVGEPLYSGPTPQAIMAKRAASGSDLGQRLAGLPAGLATALTRALSPRPEARFASTAEFAAALAATAAEPPERSGRGWLRWLGLVLLLAVTRS